jgi:chromosome segregation ATPase
MNTSIEGIVSFLKDKDNLIKQLMETAESATQEITELADRVDHAREEAKVLVDQLGAVQFSVGEQDETKVRQKALLEAVATLRKKFQTRMTHSDAAFMRPRFPTSACSWPTPSTTKPLRRLCPSTTTRSQP